MRTLWLVRHGESTWNALGLAQGHDDRPELTSRGRRQAAEVAGRFRGVPVRALYASDLRRARQTAAPLAAIAGVPVTLDARLRERRLGVLQGTPAAANGPAATGVDPRAGRLADPDKRPDGGESVRDLYRRAAGFLADLTSGRLPVLTVPASGRLPVITVPAGGGPPVITVAAGGRAVLAEEAMTAADVVIVAHGGTLRVLAACLRHVPVEAMDWAALDNATVLKFPHPNGGAI